METVNIYNIYLHMARFYEIKRFKVQGVMNDNRFTPNETIIDFLIPKDTNINVGRLNRILDREIKWVISHAVVINDFRVTIHIMHRKEKSIMEYDFESRLN
jgi:hypothetical protein